MATAEQSERLGSFLKDAKLLSDRDASVITPEIEALLKLDEETRYAQHRNVRSDGTHADETAEEPGVLVLTDQRILFCSKTLGEVTTESFPLATVEA